MFIFANIIVKINMDLIKIKFFHPKVFTRASQICGISLPYFFVYSLIIQIRWHPLLAAWQLFSVAAKPPSTTHLTQIFRGSAATLNDFQMDKTGCHCVCVIKLYTKKCGREIPKNLRHPNPHTKSGKDHSDGQIVLGYLGCAILIQGTVNVC